MKKTCCTLAALILLGAVVAGAQERAVIRSVAGKVEIQLPGQAWKPAVAGAELPLKAVISTGFGAQAVIELSASTLTVRPLTRLRLDELASSGKLARTELSMPVGRVKAEVRSREGIQTEFKVRSPVSTAAVRGTGFEFDGVNVKVTERSVNLQNAAGLNLAVSEGETGNAGGALPPAGGLAEREKNAAVSTSVGGGGGMGLGGRSEELGTGRIVVRWTR
jgi:hypothetical protein